MTLKISTIGLDPVGGGVISAPGLDPVRGGVLSDPGLDPVGGGALSAPGLDPVSDGVFSDPNVVVMRAVLVVGTEIEVVPIFYKIYIYIKLSNFILRIY